MVARITAATAGAAFERLGDAGDGLAHGSFGPGFFPMTTIDLAERGSDIPLRIAGALVGAEYGEQARRLHEEHNKTASLP